MGEEKTGFDTWVEEKLTSPTFSEALNEATTELAAELKSKIVEDPLDLLATDREAMAHQSLMSAIPSAESRALCAYVVLARTLQMMKPFAKVCMAELMRRKELGDDFDFEAFIDEECKKVKLPGKTPALVQIKNFI